VRRRTWLLLPLLLIVVLLLLYQSGSRRPFELIFLDVGQGDATFLRTPEGKTALIDGGRSGKRLLEQLDHLGVTGLDLVVATHADVDHIGGLLRAVEAYPPRFFMDNGIPHTTQAYEKLLLAVEHSGSSYLNASERTITLGDARLTVLPPPRESENQNDNSIGVLLRYRRFKALLTGDSTAKEQAWWLEHYRDDLAGVTVYKAAHHGSRTGDRESFVGALSPAMIVISVGGGNSYGHPHPEALAAYRQVGAKLYRTDQDGAVTVMIPLGGRAGYLVRTGELEPTAAVGVPAVVTALLTRLWGR